MFSEEKYFDMDKLVDEALKTEPQFKLSDNFADIVAEKVSRKFAWQQYLREFLIYLGAITGLLAIPVIFQFVLFDASWQYWMQVVTANIPLLTGIIFLLVFILFADRVLLRYFMHRSSSKQILY
jgi:membrane protein YdbS with pleckstrin-like domain